MEPIMNQSQVRLKDIRLLNEAIREAEGWKGNLHPDDFKEFDDWIKDLREALDRVKNDRRLLRDLLSQEREN